LNLDRAAREMAAEYRDGTIHPIECYRRDGRVLRLSNLNELLVKAINVQPRVTKVFEMLYQHFSRYSVSQAEVRERLFRSVEALEALLLEGWIAGEFEPTEPIMNMKTPSLESL
jgi:hypothetical protein